MPGIAGAAATSSPIVAFEVTQAPLTTGAVYQVRKRRAGPVVYTVRGGSVLLPTGPTPKFTLIEGDEGDQGPTVGVLTGNFIKTEYQVDDGAGHHLGALVFPAVAFKKTFTLTVGGAAYEADGGVFRGVFQCSAKDGDVVLEIAKELSIRDTFSVKSSPSLPYQVGLLSAVAIHSRFYAMV